MIKSASSCFIGIPKIMKTAAGFVHSDPQDISTHSTRCRLLGNKFTNKHHWAPLCGSYIYPSIFYNVDYENPLFSVGTPLEFKNVQIKSSMFFSYNQSDTFAVHLLTCNRSF